MVAYNKWLKEKTMVLVPISPAMQKLSYAIRVIPVAEVIEGQLLHANGVPRSRLSLSGILMGLETQAALFKLHRHFDLFYWFGIMTSMAPRYLPY